MLSLIDDVVAETTFVWSELTFYLYLCLSSNARSVGILRIIALYSAHHVRLQQFGSIPAFCGIGFRYIWPWRLLLVWQHCLEYLGSDMVLHHNMEDTGTVASCWEFQEHTLNMAC